MKKIALITILLVLSSGCINQKESEVTPPEFIWMKIVPVGCLENNWEMGWLSKNGLNYSAYPMEREFEILTEFYASRNLIVLEVANETFRGSECGACSCPRGDVVWIKIPYSNKSEAISEGFLGIDPEFHCDSIRDCIIVSNCCECELGGRRYGINKNFKKKWDDHLTCGQVPCVKFANQHVSCNATLACKFNECRMESL
ncbi:MAG: hypothetical protein ABH851_09185 [Methanobacteriota archaeon]